MARVFALVALASVIVIAHAWPSADGPISDEERAELRNDLKEWLSTHPEAPTPDMVRAYLQMKYIEMKQEQMNRLYFRLSNEIGRPSKGLWRKKKNSPPTLTAQQHPSTSQSSRNPIIGDDDLSYDWTKSTIGQLLRPSQPIWKKNVAAITDDDDQLMDIWKSGFRFKKSEP